MEREGWLALRKQAQAFWVQAQADYATAITLADAGIYYASVFFSQQAAEKGLKSAAISKQHKDPKSHHLIQMANSLDAPIEVMNAAAELNADFLASRNPDASDGVPAYLYDRKSAEVHLRAAEVILEWVKGTL
ncbi:MAG TPA: HEPN domain-containing protein [Armatimonadota bacterium]|nr:HEPN domain-containing protein [Armatimonadota bacterium]